MILTYRAMATLELTAADVIALDAMRLSNARDRNAVAAIKYLRARFNLSLVDAKNAFEAYERCVVLA